jgi:hypothetical protein
MTWQELINSKDFKGSEFMSLLSKNILKGQSFKYLSNRFEVVEKEGGEGYGETAWTVWRVNKDYHIKLVYSYYSYDGYSTDGCLVRDIYVVEKKIVQREEWVNVEN